MRYPAFVQEGATLAVAAPSFGCTTEPYLAAFQNAQRALINRGYRVKVWPGCTKSSGIGISQAPQACARELTDALLDSQTQAVLSCGGGELMCEILPYLPLDTLRSAPAKWFMGLSDNTNYVHTSVTALDTAAIYGPCAPAFGMEPWHASLEDALALLRGEKRVLHSYPLWEKEKRRDEQHPLEPYHVTEKPLRYYWPQRTSGGRCTLQGRLLGGCLDCLAVLLGTEFDHTRAFCDRYRADGILWVLESCDLNPMAVRRALWQMKHAGWFRHAAGFLFGRPLHYGEEMLGLNQYRAVTDVLGELHLPIVMDADVGHLPPAMPLIMGSRARVRCEAQKITVEHILD